eukprot:5373048-Alexandrium_andersonii.AAC.1
MVSAKGCDGVTLPAEFPWGPPLVRVDSACSSWGLCRQPPQKRASLDLHFGSCPRGLEGPSRPVESTASVILT